jgi:RNA polymerase sigma-70 factor, ECF subfamily
LKVISLHKNQALLIKRLKQDNREAQELLFNRFSSKMLGVCRQYITDRHRAEELMLNGFLKVFKKLNTFKSEGSFEGWIRRIMINECLSYLRKNDRLLFVEDPQIFEETISEKEPEEDVSALQKLIDDLPESWRVVFNLYAVEGYKHKEIGLMLDITEMTSRSRYFKAKKQLQAAYLNLKDKIHGKRY